MRKQASVIIMCLALLGCQTVQSGGDASSIYHIFFTQADHIKELLTKGKVQEASDVYSGHEGFFRGKGNTFNELLGKLRTGVEDMASAELDELAAKAEAQDWPVSREQWPDIAGMLKTLDSRTMQWKSNTILSREQRSPTIAKAESAANALREKIENSAPEEFKQFDLFADPSFADAYPIDINLTSLFANDAERILALINDGDRDRIKILKGRYDSDLPPGLKSSLSGIYFEKTHAMLLAQGQGRIGALLEAIEQSGNAGFAIDKVDTARIKAIDITSKTLVNAAQIEFPIELEEDLPIAVEISDLDKAVSADTEVDTEILLLIDIAAAKVNRDILEYEPVASEHQVGTQSYQNPSYAGAQNSVTHAQMGVQNANTKLMNNNTSFCSGYGCVGQALAGIAYGLAVNEAEKKLTAAMTELQTTPMMLERPVYAAYSFRKASIDASKMAVVNYYIIDKNAGKYVKGTFDAKQEQSFTVPYNMQLKDRYRSRHLSGLDAEKDVEAFEEKPFAVSLTSIIQEYSAAKEAPKKLDSLRSLRTRILRDKDIAMARFQADPIKPDESLMHNELAQSIVSVHNLNGTQGAGFYVDENLILTNYSLVEESEFVELTLKEGAETFGKIIAKDIRRNLALIQTQHHGRPVKFHHGDSIKIGAAAFAIRHRDGLDFLVTHATVSAVRPYKSSEGTEVYFVQTDKPVGPGNSGGPLFLDGRVIGVNDWGRSKQNSEGLNFTIHVREVLKFLETQDVRVNVGAAA